MSQKIVSPGRFLKFFPQWLRIFKQNFTHLLYIHIYGKLQNFIQLSLNLTKLCYIKRNHPTTTAWNTTCRASGGSPWCRKVRNANSDCKHLVNNSLTCKETENLRLNVTPNAFMCSTLWIPATAGGGIVSFWLFLGRSKMIFEDLAQFSLSY